LLLVAWQFWILFKPDIGEFNVIVQQISPPYTPQLWRWGKCFSEISVFPYKTTQCHNPGDRNLYYYYWLWRSWIIFCFSRFIVHVGINCWHKLIIGIYDSCSLERVGPYNMKTDGCRCAVKCHVRCTAGRVLQKGILIFCVVVQHSAVVTLWSVQFCIIVTYY
jgi:hypothetical protein